MTKEIVTINIKKNSLKIIICVIAVIVGLAFIPSKKEISLPDHEHSEKYNTAISYKYKAYNQNTRCLDDAIDYSNGDKDYYHELAAKCKGIDTNTNVDIIKFSNGSCNYSLDYTTNLIHSDCEEFYIKNGRLYDNLKIERISKDNFKENYSRDIDVKVVSGSSITVETYYTKECHVFGLVCSSGEWLDDGTNMNMRLVIGKNVNIKRYNTTCDRESGKAMLDEENCIYADDTYKTITIDNILKL